MKKTIKKFGLITIIALTTCLFHSMTIFADITTPPATTGPTTSTTTAEQPILPTPDVEKEDEFTKALSTAIDDAKKAPCIDTEGADKAYAVTIIEEPLTLTESETKTANGDNFESRICYRNYLSFTPNKGRKEETITTLSRICSESIKSDKFAGEKYKKINTKYTCQTVQVLLSKGGTTMIESYIGLMYKWSVGIAGIIAVVVIIFSGIQISASGSDNDGITEAKKRIGKSLLGLAILLLSGLILYTVNPNFFVK